MFTYYLYNLIYFLYISIFLLIYFYSIDLSMFLQKPWPPALHFFAPRIRSVEGPGLPRVPAGFGREQRQQGLHQRQPDAGPRRLGDDRHRRTGEMGEMGEMGWGVAKSQKRWGKTSESGEKSRFFWDLEDIFWELKMVLLKPCMVKWCWCYGVELAERPWWRWGFLPPQLVMNMFNDGVW